MDLVIDSQGTVRCLYGETIDLQVLGQPHIRRASHVEPDEQGQWWADLAPVSGPHLGPFAQRSQALQAEQEWLNRHWLMVQPGPSHNEATGQEVGTDRTGSGRTPLVCQPPFQARNPVHESNHRKR